MTNLSETATLQYEQLTNAEQCLPGENKIKNKTKRTSCKLYSEYTTAEQTILGLILPASN